MGNRFLSLGPVLFYCLVLLVVASFIYWARQARAKGVIEQLNAPPAPFDPAAHASEDFPVIQKKAIYDPDPGLTYPLKVYVELLNNTTACAEVRISRWFSGPGVRAEVLDAVLQLWLGYGWFPKPNGIQMIHVPPGERFRLWILPDQQYKIEEVQRLCDATSLGALTIRVDGQERGILI